MTSPPYLAGPARGYYRDVYVGPPGKLMKLAVPDSGIKYPVSRAGTTTELLGGGVGKVAQKRARRTISYSWSERHEAESGPAYALYSGILGEGPFIVMDPTWRNLLCYESSAFPSWGIADQTVVAGTTGTASTGLWPAGGLTSSARYDAGYIAWTTASGGNNTQDTALIEAVRSGATIGAHSGTTSRTGRAIPYVSTLPYTFSCLVRSDTANAQVRAALLNLGAAGSSATAPIVSSSLVTLATAGTDYLVQVTVPANYAPTGGWGNAARQYIAPALLSPTASVGLTSSFWMVRASALSATNVPWSPGIGCPRVIVDSDSDMGSTYYERRSMTLALREM